MRFRVRHRTAYLYSAPVRLGEHLLRVNPRPDAGRLIERELVVTPTPSRRADEIDGYGNLVTRLWFDGATERFEIDSRFALETAAAPPARNEPALAPYLEAPPPAPSVRDFARALFDAAGGETAGFLQRLNETIYRDIRHDIRAEGAARRPEETLALGHGACRDVTALFLAACRSLGVPARFVSGYQAEADAPDGRRHLHAWAEAYLTGQGWLAYDPTHLIPVAEAHVALAAAPSQDATMPVEGGFWGAGVTSALTYAVEIETG